MQISDGVQLPVLMGMIFLGIFMTDTVITRLEMTLVCTLQPSALSCVICMPLFGSSSKPCDINGHNGLAHVLQCPAVVEKIYLPLFF